MPDREVEAAAGKRSSPTRALLLLLLIGLTGTCLISPIVVYRIWQGMESNRQHQKNLDAIKNWNPPAEDND